MIESLTPTVEDYLEAISNLEKEVKAVRVKDIARVMNVKLPTVTSMLNTLIQKGLVSHKRYEYVELTTEGERLAQGVQKRHDTLFKFLSGILNIDPKIAEVDACKMEHSISPETLEKFIKFIEFVETCPKRDRPDWLKSFDHYFKTGRRLKCEVGQLKQKAKVL
ncbi:MAG: metal-dependent transcriptional regulator [Thermodesulfovibrionales bacterium]|nr:metal-dependent transcriptional regulator [Thermodesulfovibrionales bacterium]